MGKLVILEHFGNDQNVSLELISVHQTIKGDPNDGLDKFTIAQLGVQYGHMGYYFITVAFMLVTVMLLSCCVPYYVVLLLDVMFVHVLHLSCLVCMYPNCFVAIPLYILDP